MAAWTCAGCTTVYAVGAPVCPHCGSTERNDRAGGAVLPSLTVECQTDGCMHAGKPRRVHLRTAALGVLEMPSLVCAGCGLEMYRVVPWPPVTETENTMPKITRHGGASSRHEPETAGVAEPTPAEAAPAPDEEEVQPSPGKSSSPSPEKPPTTSEPNEPAAPKRARTTASPSKKGQTGSASAPSTAGKKTDESSDD